MTGNKDYSRGYAAGRRKTEAEMQELRELAEQRLANSTRLRNEVFLAVLPSALTGDWTRGDNKITTVPDRITLAEDMADKAFAKLKGV